MFRKIIQIINTIEFRETSRAYYSKIAKSLPKDEKLLEPQIRANALWNEGELNKEVEATDQGERLVPRATRSSTE